jgi:hypothetical protein
MNIMMILKWGVLVISVLLINACSNQKMENVESVSYQHTYKESFSDENYLRWKPNLPQHWEVIEEKGQRALHLLKSGRPDAIRKPTSQNILSHLSVTDFELTVEAKSLADSLIEGRDLCIFFGYQDDHRYYYTHISNHNHQYHNIVALVNNKDRMPITAPLTDNAKARLTGYGWHHIKVVRNIISGSIEIFVNDMETPIHSLIDSTFLQGHIGLGSFDDIGMFRNLTLKYNVK